MGYTFRTSGAWGAGKGSNLTPAEVDQNFWQVILDIAEKAVPGVGISEFQVEGDQLSVILSDHSVLGPYTLPKSQLNFQGEWLSNNQYLVNDIFTEGGSTYMVLMNHTSAATFDPGATDGLGSDYYGLLLANPALTIPAGGAVGMMIFKATSADYSMLWDFPRLADLHDVQQTPGPEVGEVLAWDGDQFIYKNIEQVKLVDLADVIQTPGPEDGDSVSWDETLGLFVFRPTAGNYLATLPDVQQSPPPEDGQVLMWDSATQKFTFKFPYLWQCSDVDDAMGIDVAESPSAKNVGYNDLLTWDGEKWTNKPAQPFQDWSTSSFSLNTTYANNYINASASSGTQTILFPRSVDIFGVDGWGDVIAWPQGFTFKIRQNDSTVILDPDTSVHFDYPDGRLPQHRCKGSLIQVTSYVKWYSGFQEIDHWFIDGDLAYDTVTVSATGGAIDLVPDTEVYKLTPTASGTYTVSSVPIGKRMVLIITTSGTTSYTLTFGSGFKTTGTLATGTVSGKVFTIAFLGDGTNMVETSRTTAM